MPLWIKLRKLKNGGRLAEAMSDLFYMDDGDLMFGSMFMEEFELYCEKAITREFKKMSEENF